jgi:hypothetical protein
MAAPSPEILFRALDGGGVLVHLDGNRVFELNETAAHIWMELARGSSEEAIVSSVLDAFDVSAETAAREVRDLLRELVSQGLIVP